jgi:acetyl-CoA carboxylase biotin carboxyl carrier protein
MPAGAKQAMSDQDNPQPETNSTAPSRQSERHRDRGRRRHRPMPRHLEASINMDELRELIGLITDNALSDFELEREGFHVKIGRNLYRPPEGPVLPPVSEQHAIPASTASSAVQSVRTSSPPHPGAHAEEEASEDLGLHIVNSPIVGTFYRSPSPTADPFVRIGETVKKAEVLCIIEAMKLMNEIEADVDGEVAKIYVENGQAVEYGQPLFGIRTQ